MHPEYVISAGHCFSNKKFDNPSWDELTVAFGVNDISLIDDPFLNDIAKVIQKKKIKTVHFHEKYFHPEAYR